MTEPKIYVEFWRSNLPLFDDGFDFDLGTGLPHRSSIQCMTKGLNNQPATATSSTIVCKLMHGTKPNPTKIEITGFAEIFAGTAIELHFPKIFMPLLDK